MNLVSKKSRYALHGLAYMANSEQDHSVSFDEILAYLKAYSQHLTLSPGYIAKIFQQVSRAGLVESVPGPHGGYRLARAADSIRLIDVVTLLEGPLFTDCCLLSVGTCPKQEECGVRDVIREAEEQFASFLTHETIASIAARMKFPDPSAVDRQRSVGEPTATGG